MESAIGRNAETCLRKIPQRNVPKVYQIFLCRLTRPPKLAVVRVVVIEAPAP